MGVDRLVVTRLQVRDVQIGCSRWAEWTLNGYARYRKRECGVKQARARTFFASWAKVEYFWMASWMASVSVIFKRVSLTILGIVMIVRAVIG
jgi:hypothetical protein